MDQSGGQNMLLNPGLNPEGEESSPVRNAALLFTLRDSRLCLTGSLLNWFMAQTRTRSKTGRKLKKKKKKNQQRPGNFKTTVFKENGFILVNTVNCFYILFCIRNCSVTTMRCRSSSCCSFTSNCLSLLGLKQRMKKG